MNSRPLLHAAAALAIIALLEGCTGSSIAARDGKEAVPEAALLAADDVACVVVADLVAGVPVSRHAQPGGRQDHRADDEVLETVLVREGQAVAAARCWPTFAPAPSKPSRPAPRPGIATRRRLRAPAEPGRGRRGVDARRRGRRWPHGLGRPGGRPAKRLEDATVRSPIAGVVAVRSVQSGDRVSAGDPLFRVVNTRELEFEATVRRASS